MNITNRLFTYPVLSEEKDDYETSVFDVKMSHQMDGVNSLKLHFNFIMDNKEINDLIYKGDAEYIIHLECGNTSYRETVSEFGDECNISIPIGRIKGKLELLAFIITKKDIVDFYSADLNEDFSGIRFNIAKASILGYKNLPSLEISKNFEELENAASIFSIYKKMSNENNYFEVNADGDRIKVGLNADEYELYLKFCQISTYQPILNTMIILPALAYIFEELKQEGGIETHDGKDWFISLDRAYAKRGIDFIREINDEDKTSLLLAQEAMEYPLKDALSALKELSESLNEEEIS